MEKSKENEKNYIFSTSIDYSSDPDEFIVELFSPDDEDTCSEPKMIHDFDELISFFENLDEVNKIVKKELNE